MGNHTTNSGIYMKKWESGWFEQNRLFGKKKRKKEQWLIK